MAEIRGGSHLPTEAEVSGSSTRPSSAMPKLVAFVAESVWFSLRWQVVVAVGAKAGRTKRHSSHRRELQLRVHRCTVRLSLGSYGGK